MSSAISSINYDSKTQTLMVSFVKGGSHSYSEVPPEVAEAFQRAPSKGKFFNETIKGSYG